MVFRPLLLANDLLKKLFDHEGLVLSDKRLFVDRIG
jgi:hypothetical protein